MEPLILKVFIPTTLAFIFGVLLTPLVTHFLYKHKAWKKTGGKKALNGMAATEFNRLKAAEETKTPRMGGIVIWGSVFLTVGLLAVADLIAPDTLVSQLDFFSRSQTWIPLATFAIGALLGFIGDYYDVTHTARELRLSVRLLLIALLAGGIAWWFYDKLEVTSVSVPFNGAIELGILIIPFFIVMTMAMYASGVIDGIDGLSGGVFAAIFSAYTGVAFIQSQFDLAALCATIVGGILAFLWFNIPPARFYMTETGSMALTLTLSVVVFMTDTLGEGNGISLFLVIGIPLIVTVLSNLIQISYRRATGRKFFRIAPLHHHFEAIGWPSYKVTMRYWVISTICAIIGVAIAAVA